MVLNCVHMGIRNLWGPGETDRERDNGTWLGGRKEEMNRKEERKRERRREREGKKEEEEGRKDGGRWRGKKTEK